MTSMSEKQKAIFYIVCSAFFFALMNMFVKMAGDLPAIQKSFFRNFVAFFMALFLLMRSGAGFSFQKKNLPAFFGRSIFGTLGILCNFYSVDHLLLSDASILNKLSPFFAILSSYFILKEKITPIQGTAVAVAFGGALLVVKPGFAMAGVLVPHRRCRRPVCRSCLYSGSRPGTERRARAFYCVVFFRVFVHCHTAVSDL